MRTAHTVTCISTAPALFSSAYYRGDIVLTPATEAPYYEEGADHTSDASFQISQLVRNGSDARRLLVPIQDWAWRPKQSKLAKELESMLQTWDNQILQIVPIEHKRFWMNWTTFGRTGTVWT